MDGGSKQPGGDGLGTYTIKAAGRSFTFNAELAPPTGAFAGNYARWVFAFILVLYLNDLAEQFTENTNLMNTALVGSSLATYLPSRVAISIYRNTVFASNKTQTHVSYGSLGNSTEPVYTVSLTV